MVDFGEIPEDKMPDLVEMPRVTYLIERKNGNNVGIDAFQAISLMCIDLGDRDCRILGKRDARSADQAKTVSEYQR
jgi:hypothetical protein